MSESHFTDKDVSPDPTGDSPVLEVVYLALRGADLNETLDRLRAAGLHPVAVDDPDPDLALVVYSGRSLRIRVAVPREEVVAARRVIQSAGGVPESTRKLARSVEIGALKFALSVAALVGLTALAYELEPEFPWYKPALGIAVLWIVFLWIRAHRRSAALSED